LRFRWKEPHEDEFYSEEVKIVFCALYSTVNQIAAEAYAVQNHDVTKEMVETVSFTPFFCSRVIYLCSVLTIIRSIFVCMQWLCVMKSMMTEVEWRRSQHVPTVEEYMIASLISGGLGPSVLKPLYFLGLQLPDYVVRDQEYKELSRIASTCIRLMNDTRSFEVFKWQKIGP
jgi:ent-kaurene synthase